VQGEEAAEEGEEVESAELHRQAGDELEDYETTADVVTTLVDICRGVCNASLLRSLSV
jgi:hypothetical protein